MFRFEIAISYAGEEEGIAENLYRLLLERGVKVFFAKGKMAYLLGKGLESEIPYVFGPGSRFFVPIISRNYVKKRWPLYELRSAIEEESRRRFEFILPIRLDDVDLEGLEEDRVYLDLRKEGLFRVADILIEKLREKYPPEEIIVPTHWVATFGVNTYDLLKSDELPPAAPRDYPHLCDWLTEDLMNHLYLAPIEDLRLLEDLRTGETLSVSVGFIWNPDKTPLDFGNIGWWEVLEVEEFKKIYPDQD